MKKTTKSAVSMMVALCLTAGLLTGCSNDAKPAASEVTATSATTVEVTEALTAAPTDTPAPTTTPTIEPTAAPNSTPSSTPGMFDGLTDTQRDSVSMLNYLTVMVQNIRESKSNRVYLQQTYSSIVDNTLPNAIDNRTLGQLNSILDTLHSYCMIAEKRERIEYIYEQGKAQAIRAALPNPLALMSAVQSFSLPKLIASGIYMAVDAVNSFENANTKAEMQFLQGNWDLDDAEKQTLHDQRKEAFTYMVRTVNENKLPGSLALTEEAVDKYVEWATSSNNTGRIRFLESNRDTYKAFGGYWLLLARSYYDDGAYQMCLDAITNYESLGIKIFRYDYDYAEVLPMAIVSAQAVQDSTQYIDTAAKYAAAIVTNTQADRWALRYFAAQTYVDLAAKTQDYSFLYQAYEITLDAVNELVANQRALNAKYLSPVTEIKAKAGATKTEKTDVEQYNKLIKQTRKTELPPVLEPLLVNCELLFSLMEQLGITSTEQPRVDAILHENGTPLFLVKPVDALFRFGGNTINSKEIEITFDGKTLTIPAEYIATDWELSVTFDNGDGEIVRITDWKVDKVTRKTEGTLDTFTATIISEQAKKQKYAAGMTVYLHLTPSINSSADQIHFTYKVEPHENWGPIPDGIDWVRE